MPSPPKAIKVTRTIPGEFTFTTLNEHLKRDKRAKELIGLREEADRQREEDGREQREIDERRRLDEEFNEWWRQEQIKKKERLRLNKEVNEKLNEWRQQQSREKTQSNREQSSREQYSKNPELIAASITLGIPIDSNMHKINKAYRRLARQTHPDRSVDPDATAKFQKLLEAYEILSAHQRMSKNGGNKCRNRRTSHHRPKKSQKPRHTTHHRKTHRVRV
jgi:hypothetical protein